MAYFKNKNKTVLNGSRNKNVICRGSREKMLSGQAPE